MNETQEIVLFVAVQLIFDLLFLLLSSHTTPKIMSCNVSLSTSFRHGAHRCNGGCPALTVVLPAATAELSTICVSVRRMRRQNRSFFIYLSIAVAPPSLPTSAS
jgi:hypothetical protein